MATRKKAKKAASTSKRTNKAVASASPADSAISPTDKPKVKGDPQTGMSLLQEKWGRPLIEAGWVAFPSIILERQDALGLDAGAINLILHIAKHWFDVENLPHPGKKSIAKAMGVSARTIQKRLTALHEMKFVERIERRGPKGTKGSQTSKFNFEGLIAASTPFAVEALEERAKKRAATFERLKRKRPRLEIAPDPDADGSP